MRRGVILRVRQKIPDGTFSPTRKQIIMSHFFLRTLGETCIGSHRPQSPGTTFERGVGSWCSGRAHGVDRARS